MQIKKVCVLGGAGFVGRHLVHQLASAGFEVRVLTRRREHAKHLTLLPRVQVVEGDPLDDAMLLKSVMGMDAVVNLLGILHEGAAGSFAAVHARFPAHVVQACKEIGVSRLLHMSALNADLAAPSAYLRSKGEGEAAVRESGLDWTIFRPSVVFGRGDSFLTLFARLAGIMPVMLLASPDARFQPIWVEDLAAAMVRSLNEPRTCLERYDLCGPHVYTLRELVAYAGRCVGKAPYIVGLGRTASYLQAAAMEILPVKLMTRDNLRSMEVDSVCNCAFPEVFGIAPTPLEAVAPEYLSGHTPRRAYPRFRSGAGR